MGGGESCGRFLKKPHPSPHTPQAPSAIKAPIGWVKPTALTTQDVERTLDDFAKCAALAAEAGYDGVEVMGSEGYVVLPPLPAGRPAARIPTTPSLTSLLPGT